MGVVAVKSALEASAETLIPGSRQPSGAIELLDRLEPGFGPLQ